MTCTSWLMSRLVIIECKSNFSKELTSYKWLASGLTRSTKEWVRRSRWVESSLTLGTQFDSLNIPTSLLAWVTPLPTYIFMVQPLNFSIIHFTPPLVSTVIPQLSYPFVTIYFTPLKMLIVSSLASVVHKITAPQGRLWWRWLCSLTWWHWAISLFSIHVWLQKLCIFIFIYFYVFSSTYIADFPYSHTPTVYLTFNALLSHNSSLKNPLFFRDPIQIKKKKKPTFYFLLFNQLRGEKCFLLDPPLMFVSISYLGFRILIRAFFLIHFSIAGYFYFWDLFVLLGYTDIGSNL